MKKITAATITIVLFSVMGCKAVIETPMPPTKIPEPTPTVVPLILSQNDCIEFTEESVFYQNSTNNELEHWYEDGKVPARTKFIYMGAKVGDRLFVLYGNRQGWVLANYVKACE